MRIVHVAAAVVVDEYGRILLLHRDSGPFTHWELPGGIVDDEDYDDTATPDPDDDSDAETPESTVTRTLYKALGVRVKLAKKLGSADVETDEVTYRYHWFQAEVVLGEPTISGSNDYDDMDYFDIEDMSSLALTDDVMELYPKIYSGDIVLS